VSAEAAEAVALAVRDYDADLEILGPPDSELSRLCDAIGIRFRKEGFADRAYRGDGSLADRSQPGSIKEAEAAAGQALSIAVHRRVHSVDGSAVAVDADSVCVHGDTAGALHTARRVREVLDSAGVSIRAFT
jgi:UPF0271 protein